MIEAYPDYKTQDLDEVFNSLSEHNKKLISKFMEHCSITACGSSQHKIKSKIIQIADIINKELDKLTLEDIRTFLALLNKSNRAIATRNDIKKVLKRFIKFQYEDWSKKFKDLQDAKISTKNEGRRIDKNDLLTPDEMQMIVNSVESLKYKTILLLMQETANRPEELLKLKWKDINLETKEVKLNSNKTGETRTIPINESSAHLRRYKEECFYPVAKNEDYVFPSPQGVGEHLTTQALNNFLDKLEKRIKFKKHLYPYLWRHSILSRMIKKLSPKMYEMYSGHSLETGMKTYAHHDTEDLKEELFSRIYHITELTKDQNKELEILKKQVAELIERENRNAKHIVDIGNVILKLDKKMKNKAYS